MKQMGPKIGRSKSSHGISSKTKDDDSDDYYDSSSVSVSDDASETQDDVKSHDDDSTTRRSDSNIRRKQQRGGDDGDDNDDDDSDSESANKSDYDDDEGDDYYNDDDEVLREDDDVEASHSESGDGDNDDDDLPIAERIQRQNEEIVDMKKRREMKKKIALKVDRNATLLSDSTKVGDTIVNNDDIKRKKKKSKHAPTEVSSKRSDFYRNQKHMKYDMNENGIGVSINNGGYKSVDPRSSSLTGHLNEDTYEKQYNFVNDIRKKEIETLKQQIIAIKTPGRKGQRHRRQQKVSVDSLLELQSKLEVLQQEQATVERNHIDRIAKQKVQQQLKDNVATGKGGIYFPKRNEMKQMELQAKLDVIREKGGDAAVAKLVNKRRQKNKSRDASNFVGTGGKKRQRKFY